MKIRGIVFVPLIVFLLACGEPSFEKSGSFGDEIFVRVGAGSLSTEDFNAAVEIAKIPYGEEVTGDPALLASIRRQTLAELIAEMAMRERAREMGLHIPQKAVDEAVKAIESEFPEGGLDRLLFQNVVKRSVWEKRIAARLLIDKLIETELEGKATLAATEIADYCRKTMPDMDDEDRRIRGIDQELLSRLLRKKAEEAFEPYLHQLIKSYPIYVDQNAWERITAGG